MSGNVKRFVVILGAMVAVSVLWVVGALSAFEKALPRSTPASDDDYGAHDLIDSMHHQSPPLSPPHWKRDSLLAKSRSISPFHDESESGSSDELISSVVRNQGGRKLHPIRDDGLPRGSTRRSRVLGAEGLAVTSTGYELDPEHAFEPTPEGPFRSISVPSPRISTRDPDALQSSQPEIDAADPTPCISDSDCEIAERCWGGMCLTGEGNCTADEECGAESRCSRGVCSFGARECSRDLDCPTDGSSCYFGKCIGVSDECLSDDECDDSQRCLYGECKEGRRECYRDNDCPSSYRCLELTCVHGERECRVDEDCADGHRCAAGRCMEGVRECVVASDCVRGKRCQLGQCVDES